MSDHLDAKATGPLVREVPDVASLLLQTDLFLLAGGFEDRAFAALSRGQLRAEAHCVIVRFINEVPNNRAVFLRYLAEARKHLDDSHIHIVGLKGSDIEAFNVDLSAALAALPRDIRSVTIDVSGMPAHLICSVLRIVREHRSREKQVILYTSAREYTPTRAEYDQIGGGPQDDIELVPRSLALEMSDNLIPDAFKGYRSQAAKACLVIFAGYEVHRAAGVIDAINPSLLLLLYGRPGDPTLAWRLELSTRLHKKFERGRKTAVEVVSTLSVAESLATLERYYNFLIDEYDLVIAPISSKMETVAAYLFWERYGETQLIFPIPIGYDPANCPQGASTTYQLVLDPRRTLFKAESGSLLTDVE